MSYESDKRAGELTETLALTDYDWMFIEKDGSNIATKIPLALLTAYVSGAEYRADSVNIPSGITSIEFSSDMASNDYKVHFYTRDANRNQVAADVVPDSEAVGGFSFEAMAACTLTYYAIPNK